MEWYNWVLCILLFFIVPATVIFWRKIAVTAHGQSGYNKPKFIGVSIFQTLFYWLLGAFHLCAIFNVLSWTFIFGVISMVIIFYNLANVFINKVGTSKTLNKLGLLQDFIVGLVITVYLIYIIPKEFKTLQTIITAVVAAVYGGLLTLTGVAWTIRHSERQKRDDDLAKAKPLFTFNIFVEENPKVNNRKICLVGEDLEGGSFDKDAQSVKAIKSYMDIENSPQCTFIIKRFYFDRKWHRVFSNNTLLPNNRIIVDLARVDLAEHPIMEIEDIFGRKFYYDLMFLIIERGNNKLATLGEMKEISMREVLDRNIKIDEGKTTNE